jgi:hypothetical protein
MQLYKSPTTVVGSRDSKDGFLSTQTLMAPMYDAVGLRLRCLTAPTPRRMLLSQYGGFIMGAA